MVKLTKNGMGALTMLGLLVLVIVLLPLLLRLCKRTISGFNDMSTPPASVSSPPSIPNTPNSHYVPDPNTNYLCRSPNDNGVPCPEGQFCDGTTQTCRSKTVPTLIDSVIGYFS